MAVLGFAEALDGIHKFGKFNPDEARDKDGRWTSGGAVDRALSPYETFEVPGGPGRSPRISAGGGAAFASPSITDKDFAGAQVDLTGQRHKVFDAAAHDIDHQLGLATVKHSDVIGAWADGAENSTMMESQDASREALKVSAAMKGALAHQKAVLVFSRDPGGRAALYDMTVPSNAQETHAALLKAGIAFHTLSPTGKGTRVLVADLDGTLGGKVGDFAGQHGVTAERTFGHAEFIGDQEGGGSDTEQRDRAQRAYEGVIASATSKYQGRSAAELWRGIGDRWGGRLQALKRAIGFGDALDAIRKLTDDPGLYVHRPLVNAAELHSWAQGAGIQNLVPPGQMHVTQVYSRKAVPLERRTDAVTAAGGARSIKPLGDKGAVVLHFRSAQLDARHDEALGAGATHDFPTFQTHVTLSYDAGGADVAAITPPTFPLQFGPEQHEPLNENWAEDAGLRIGKYNEDEARDNDGRWTSGGSNGGGDFGPDMGESIDEDVAYERMATALTNPRPANLKAVTPVLARAVKQEWIAQSPLKTVQDVYAGAEANKTSLDGASQKIADDLGIEYRSPGVKGTKRVLEKDFSVEKIAAGRTPAGVTDIVRGTFVVPTPEAADHAVNALAQHFPITDEGWKATKVGYFDRAVNVKFPNGQIGEVLLAPPELIQAKSNSGGGGHALYQEWRTMDENHPRALELAAQQRQLYGAARASLSPSWRQVIG